jgi:hypothetical protein
LSNGRELALLSLLNDNNIDVGIITETEIPTSSHGDFNVEGYHTFLPVGPSDKLKTAKYRMHDGCVEVRAGSHHKNSTRFNAPGRAERMDSD